MDREIKGFIVGDEKECKFYDLIYEIDYSRFDDDANAVSGILLIRKRFGFLSIELGGGLGWMDRDIEGIVKGTQGIIQSNIGIEWGKFKIKLGVDHRSNPFKDGKDGDIGGNFLKLHFEYLW
jgi:hypothetical protein